MQVGGSGSLPINIARAYGLGSTCKSTPAQPPAEVKPVASVNQLIAGRTNQPLEFDAAAAVQPAKRGDSLQLYTSAAARIEAAVGIEVGKTLDVKG